MYLVCGTKFNKSVGKLYTATCRSSGLPTYYVHDDKPVMTTCLANCSFAIFLWFAMYTVIQGCIYRLLISVYKALKIKILRTTKGQADND